MKIAAPLAGLLREQVVPSPQSVKFGDDRVQTSREARIPFRPIPSMLVDELTAVVLGWAAEAYRLLGPRLTPTGFVWLSETIERLSLQDGAVARLRSTDVGEIALTVGEAQAFLLDRFDDVVGLPIVADLHDEVVDVIRRALNATGQSRLRVEDSIGSLCPVCLTREVWVTWEAAEEPTVVCKRCSLVLHAGKDA
ncbi:hypothetical protein [Gulosibacter faecalis]|uniref:Uncharacterized protein n=1 Tax=Gulosibacter faecalis TaxID=272240 RepID=A0ABW5UXC3_9MICO|nr:hypothetical protein [Gulosibacter faecalis]